jgi:ABC-type Fe2+-enterobactin transport system substrate-binding protein
MWNDDRPDSEQISAQAYTLVKNYLEEAWQNRMNLNS